MKIELKNTKTFPAREGIGFTASVYVDGVRTAVVSDSGWGAIVYDVLETIDEDRWNAFTELASSLSEEESFWPEWQDIVDQLVNDYLMKRSTKKVLIKDGGEYYTFNRKYKKEDHARIEALVKERYPDAVLVSGNPIFTIIGEGGSNG